MSKTVSELMALLQFDSLETDVLPNGKSVSFANLYFSVLGLHRISTDPMQFCDQQKVTTKAGFDGLKNCL